MTATVTVIVSVPLLWLCCDRAVAGCWRVFLQVPPPGVVPSHDESEVTSPVSLAEWFINFHPMLKDLNVGYITYVMFFFDPRQSIHPPHTHTTPPSYISLTPH